MGVDTLLAQGGVTGCSDGVVLTGPMATEAKQIDMLAALADEIDSGAIDSATVGDTTSEILAADANRLGYVVTSLASELVYTAIGASAVMSKGGALSAMPTTTQIGGQMIVSGAAAKLALNGICASGGMTVLTQTFLKS